MVSNRFAQPVRVVPHAGYHPKEFAAAIPSAVAPVRYDLRGVDNGQTIFSREIATQAHFNGGNAAERAKRTARAAILSNIASATLCLDKAAFGLDPEDRALTPVSSFCVPITVVARSYSPDALLFASIDHGHLMTRAHSRRSCADGASDFYIM